MSEDKDIWWEGSSLDDLRSFPEDARHAMGYQLHRVQSGEMPEDWKPLNNLGKNITGFMKLESPLIGIYIAQHM